MLQLFRHGFDIYFAEYVTLVIKTIIMILDTIHGYGSRAFGVYQIMLYGVHMYCNFHKYNATALYGGCDHKHVHDTDTAASNRHFRTSLTKSNIF